MVPKREILKKKILIPLHIFRNADRYTTCESGVEHNAQNRARRNVPPTIAVRTKWAFNCPCPPFGHRRYGIGRYGIVRMYKYT